jgi:predicted O-methyltransferase YrrM
VAARAHNYSAVPDVAAIRSVNDAIAADPRVKVVLIPIGDGVSLVQKLR